MKSTINDINTKLPESEFDDLVLDLIDDYLVEEPLVKGEKKSSQNPRNKRINIKLDEHKMNTQKNRNKLNATNKIRANHENTKLTEVNIESQTLQYNLKLVEAADTSYIIESIEFGFECQVEIEEGAQMDLRKTVKMNLIKRKKMKIGNIPVSLEKVMNNKPKLVLDEEDPD
ncbi:24493_t:CDS:2 [Gigaspora margarita]|uniref:24493_t:CDS:1 n=1 Tax=Gigaspora margarita TaxID=4874 RepID=A0ABN7ULG2_GIGMA|nr:24493_t:CDS:2 [Gigaspora margarita]